MPSKSETRRDSSAVYAGHRGNAGIRYHGLAWAKGEREGGGPGCNVTEKGVGPPGADPSLRYQRYGRAG